MRKTSAKKNARYLAGILKAHYCRNVVVAPGSRNAPLILALNGDDDYHCISVPDERAAAFTALGMIIGLQEPVAVICSSGSAAVNFYPAVVEAFYQKKPLIVITADRPLEWIDQGIGQSIRQENVFENHIVKSVNLLRQPGDELAEHYNQRLINEAMIASGSGPVHINVPFDEPLYDTVEVGSESYRFIKKVKTSAFLNDARLQEFAEIWNKCEKVMLLAGQMPVKPDLTDVLEKINTIRPLLLLTETTSNLPANFGVKCIDRLITPFTSSQKEIFSPDLLITIGGEIVSKRIKRILSDKKPKYHWHISEEGDVRDTFHSLTHAIPARPEDFFGQIVESLRSGPVSYRDHWQKEDAVRAIQHRKHLASSPFSDLKVFGIVQEYLPDNSILHCANSAGIRYSQLFDHKNNIEHYANRGTSGIDGCTSTAIGHALTTDKMVTFITGDVAFLYDSNAFWNDELPSNLRIIIFNNGGGNIFRIIEGPEDNDGFRRYQETEHQMNAGGIAQTYKLEYKTVKSEKALVDLLPDFYEKSSRPRILEVMTPRMESPRILKEYFNRLESS